MKYINGQITIGAPNSPIRFERVTEICADCLTWGLKQNRPLKADNKAVGRYGQCYVCEDAGRMLIPVKWAK